MGLLPAEIRGQVYNPHPVDSFGGGLPVLAGRGNPDVHCLKISWMRGAVVLLSRGKPRAVPYREAGTPDQEVEGDHSVV